MNLGRGFGPALWSRRSRNGVYGFGVLGNGGLGVLRYGCACFGKAVKDGVARRGTALYGLDRKGGQGWDCSGMAALGWAVVLRRGMAVRGLVRIGGRGTVGQRRYGVASSGLAVKAWSGEERFGEVRLG